MAQEGSRVVLTPVFRIGGWPRLLKPEQFQNKGPHRYSIEMLFQPDDLKKFQIWNVEAGDDGMFEDADVSVLMVQVAKEKWPDINVKEAVQHGGLKWPLKNGDTLAAALKEKKKEGDHYLGTRVLRASTGDEYPPDLKFLKGSERVSLNRVTDEAKVKEYFQGGNFGYAQLTVKAVETPQGRFITSYLGPVCYVKQGDRIGGGGSDLMNRFDGIKGGESDHNPTEGLDDEIPF